MRTLAPVIVTALFLVGCNSQSAQQQAAADQKLDAVLTAFAAAQEGYAPLNASGQMQELQAYRQSKLASTEATLRDVISTGSPQQKAIAGRLLAAVSISQARYTARNGMAQYTALAADSPVLTATLHAAQAAAMQVDRTQVDYDSALAQLAADSATLTQQKQQFDQQAQALNQQIAAEKAAQAQQQSQATAGMAEADKLQQQAFVAERDAKLKRLDDVDAAHRRAGAASAEAEKHQIQIDLLQRRLDVVNKQSQTVATQVADLKQQADRTRQVQASTATVVAAAEQDKKARAAELSAKFKELADRYRDQVSTPLVSAADRADEAVNLVATSAPIDQLNARINQAFINSQRAIAAAGWANLTHAISTVADLIKLADASAYKDAFTAAKAEHDAAAQVATAAIAAGRDLASTLGESPAVAAQVAHLAEYEKRLTDNAVK